jgi:hypothetical protein
METDTLSKWFKACYSVIGRGAGTYFWERVKLPQPISSRLASGKTSFDDKTLRTLALVLSSRDINFAHLPLVWEREKSGYVFRSRLDNTTEVITWELKK